MHLLPISHISHISHQQFLLEYLCHELLREEKISIKFFDENEALEKLHERFEEVIEDFKKLNDKDLDKYLGEISRRSIRCWFCARKIKYNYLLQLA